MSCTRLLMIISGLLVISLMIGSGCFPNAPSQKASGFTINSMSFVDLGLKHISEGDVKITDHETLTIQDQEYNLTVKIVAEDYATILVKNSGLTLSPVDSSGISFNLKGKSRLLVTNSTITFARPAYGDCQIVLEDEAQATFSETTVTGWGFAVGRNASSVYVEKSRIGDGILGLHSPGIAVYSTSKVVVENSTVDGVYVWGSSTSSINGSQVGVLRTSLSDSGRIMINVSNSQVGNVETSIGFPQPTGRISVNIVNCEVEGSVYAHDNSTIRIERSSIGMVRATGNATVWLIESSVDAVSFEDNAEILWGFDLPLLGLVGMPYWMKPMMQAASVIAMIAGIAAMVYGLYRKKRAEERSYLKDGSNV